MMGLTEKVVKIKKLQKTSNSFMVLIPETWVRELDWCRETMLKVQVMLGEGKIIIQKADPISQLDSDLQKDPTLTDEEKERLNG